MGHGPFSDEELKHVAIQNIDQWFKDAKIQTKGKEKYRGKLNDLQWKVAFEGGTEPPFSSKVYPIKEDGIYKSAASGAPLFSSKDKFDSGTGWPSFVKALDGSVVENTDISHGMSRTEVLSRSDGVHLGHVFNDGPKERGGYRYCINGAVLDFVPATELSAEDKIKYGF